MRKKRRIGFLSGLSTGFAVLAKMDMMASDGRSRKGEDETVVVIRERKTFVSGRTANGAGCAILSACWSGAVDGGKSAPLNVRFPDGDDWVEDEWRARVDAVLATIRGTRR